MSLVESGGEKVCRVRQRWLIETIVGDDALALGIIELCVDECLPG